MIIRTTFKDNDFSSVLESYWGRFWFVNYYTHLKKYDGKEDYDSLKEWKDKKVLAEDLLDKAFFKPDEMTVKELRQFELVIIESITSYVEQNYKEDYNYLVSNLEVKVIDGLKDQDENGEVVYYILGHKTQITM